MASSRFRLSKTATTDLLFIGIVVILQIILVKAGIFICDSVNLTYKTCLFIHLCLRYTIHRRHHARRNSYWQERGFDIFSIFFLRGSFLFQDKMSIFLLSLIGSAVAVHYIIRCERRSAFFKTGLLVGVVNMGTIVCLFLLSGKLFVIETLLTLAMGLAGGILSGFIVSGLVPLFESLFGYTTDINSLNWPI